VFPALPILIAIASMFVGLVAISCGLIGQTSLALPTCRRCRVDLRSVAWDAAPACPGCARPIVGDWAVRWRSRRRSKRPIIAGVAFILLALAIVLVDRSLHARGLQWRDLRPASVEFATLETASKGAVATRRLALQSLMRRADAGRLDEAPRAALAEQAFATIGPSVDSTWYDAAITAADRGDERLAAIVVPTVAPSALLPTQSSVRDDALVFGPVSAPWQAERAGWITVWTNIKVNGSVVSERLVLSNTQLGIALELPSAIREAKPYHVTAEWTLVLVPRNAHDPAEEALRTSGSLPDDIPAATARGAIDTTLGDTTRGTTTGGSSGS